MRRPASPSLFWTFAGAFLIVLVAGLGVQATVLFSIVGPISSARIRADAETVVRRAAHEVEQVLAVGGDPEPALAQVNDGGWEHPVIFIDTAGRIVSDRPLGPWRRRLTGDLVRLGLLAPSSLPPDSSRMREGGPPPRGNRSGPAGPRGPGRDERRLGDRIVVRAPVFANGVRQGELVTLVPPRRAFGLPPGIPRPTLFFLPTAALIAAVAGLFLFRALAHRLRALEGQAQRVAQG
ncbi:MAG: hypothetical protein KC729_07035, partial [Candidatus Eisenbacteria bacterium]|nr:hypothetical protein [Candidatus Eisenbacteria bacterium]